MNARTIKRISEYISKPIVIFDLETTGAKPDEDEIVQFGGVRIEPNGTHEVFSFLCKPDKKIHPEAVKVHGITEAQLKSEKPFKHYSSQIDKFFKDADIAGFNIKVFDHVIIKRQMQNSGFMNTFENANIIDSYLIFLKDCPRNLGSAKKYYTGKPMENAHDALGDVLATSEILAEQLLEHKIDDVAEAIKKKEYITYDKKKQPILNFSKKHKGKLLKNVDVSFLKWVLTKDFPDDVKAIIKKYVK